MVNFTVDTQDLSDEFNLSQDDIDSLLEATVQSVTQAFTRHWDDVASRELKSVRHLYRNAIQVGQQGRFVGIVYLNPAAWLPNAIEMGLGSFDMKPGLLSGSAVKQGKNGPYTTIPFQFATPGALGESGLFSGVMPKSIHKAVLKKEAQNPKTKGLSISEIPKEYQIPKSAQLRSQIKDIGFDQVMKKSESNTSIYEGLKRNKKGSGYVNFRRVSLNSQQESFIHPGFRVYNLADKALQRLNIAHEVDIAIDNYLAALGFE